MSDHTDLMFIISSDDTFRPKEILTSEGLFRADWVEPSGTRTYASKKLLLCRVNVPLPSAEKVIEVLAINGKDAWKVVGVMDPDTGQFTEKYNMARVKAYIKNVEDTPAEYDKDGNETKAATTRRPVVGNASDFGIGWFGGTNQPQSKRAWV